MIYLTFFFLLIVILLFLPVELQVKAKREQNNDKIQINLYLLNKRFKFGIDIPYVETIISQRGFFVKAEEKLETGKKEKDRKEKKQAVSMEKILGKFHKYMHYKKFFRGALLYLYKKIQIRKFIFITRIGLADAALTGFLSGLIWTVKGIMVGKLFSNKDIDDYCIDVQSEFNNPFFLINFNCIIKFKLVYIINAVFHGLMNQLRGG